jgi:hypothetical protein
MYFNKISIVSLNITLNVLDAAVKKNTLLRLTEPK